MMMDALHKKALHLEFFTVGYNAVEALVSILFGIGAGSIALIGFGLDSIVESLSGCILVWRLAKRGKVSNTEEARAEKVAIKFVALTFLLLGAYVLVESGRKLILQEIPERSLPGIILAVVSLIVMPILAVRKIRIGRAIGSRALVADSKETFVCAALSAALFIGLAMNYFFGFWQADPLVGFVVVIFLFKEGIEALRGGSSSNEGSA